MRLCLAPFLIARGSANRTSIWLLINWLQSSLMDDWRLLELFGRYSWNFIVHTIRAARAATPIMLNKIPMCQHIIFCLQVCSVTQWSKISTPSFCSTTLFQDCVWDYLLQAHLCHDEELRGRWRFCFSLEHMTQLWKFSLNPNVDDSTSERGLFLHLRKNVRFIASQSPYQCGVSLQKFNW